MKHTPHTTVTFITTPLDDILFAQGTIIRSLPVDCMATWAEMIGLEMKGSQPAGILMHDDHF